MSVTVDHEPLAADELGLRTVGCVLSHVGRGGGGGRLVVSLLIDGQEPDLSAMPAVRAAPLSRHTVFIETACPREMAVEVLAAVEAQLRDADVASAQAVTLLQQNQTAQAMGKLAGCFTVWQTAQESVAKVAQLLRLDLDAVTIAGGQSLSAVFAEFGAQLRSIRAALESRDYVTLGDVLSYETPDTLAKWRAAIGELAGSAGR